MATVSRTITKILQDGNRSWNVSWLTIPNGDDGEPITLPAHADRSVQIVGTFGAGGTIILEGSNDGTNYETLSDYLGNALSFTAEGLSSIAEVVNHIRPRVTAGDGTTALTVTLLLTGAL